MINKLRVKFICVIMVIVTCMLVTMFGVLYGSIKKNIVQDQISMMRNIADDMDHRSRPFAGGNARIGLNLFHFTLELGPKGDLIINNSGNFDLSDEEALRALYDRICAEGEETGILPGEGLRYLRAETPRGVKLVFADVSSEQATLRHLRQEIAVIGFLSFAVFSFISLLVSKWAVRPVEEAWKQQKQFVADASHELKTPLTVIMANAELLQQPGYDDGERLRFSDSILTMSRQMRHLVENLLDLARLDSTQEPPALEDLDLSALTEDCVLPFEPLYFERGLVLETEIEPGLHVRGQDHSLRQVLDILLDNAQKYSLPGTVKLTLRQAGHSCLLTVSNPSPELSKAECRELFKRFYRRDPARTDSGSYGLGLPIAESLVGRHGGKIACEWEDSLLRFTISLPLLRAQAKQ